MAETVYRVSFRPRHLAQLREFGLVVDRRAGLWVFYRVDPELPDWAQAVLGVTAIGIRRDAPYANDEQDLATMSNRPGIARCA